LPLRLELSFGSPQPQPAVVGSEVAIDRNYANRNGYALGFLGDSVPLPDVSVAAAAFGRASINRDTGESVLPYTHYSVIMNAERRLAYVSAVNIDGKLWRQIVRGQDAWTYDPRIPNAEQSGAALYDKEPGNFFDRGHLCRRLDPSWGDRQTATKGNNDTFHWTNCSPQHWRFNEGKTLWAGLEDYILANTDAEDIKACVFTGPVFRDDDLVHRQIPIPREYWKVVVVRTREGPLASSGYTRQSGGSGAQHRFRRVSGGRVPDFSDFRRPHRGADAAALQRQRPSGGCRAHRRDRRARAQLVQRHPARLKRTRQSRVRGIPLDWKR